MSRLWFVGLGLGPDGLSVRAREVARRCTHRFVETYTSRVPDGLEEAIGEVEPVGRDVVEDGGEILEAARDAETALLVPGDPMAATTHVGLRLDAVEAGLEAPIVHGASALTAVPGLLGLSHYKFGRGTTLVTPRPGYAPESPYDVIRDNRAEGLHTLVLLDTGDGEAFMPADEGLDLLIEIEARRQEQVVPPDRLVAVVARAGQPDVACHAGSAGDLADRPFGEPVHTIVVPGDLHFKERHALEVLAGLES